MMMMLLCAVVKDKDKEKRDEKKANPEKSTLKHIKQCMWVDLVCVCMCVGVSFPFSSLFVPYNFLRIYFALYIVETITNILLKFESEH